VQLIDLRSQAHGSVLDVVRTIESFEVVHPAFIAFRYAIGAQLEVCSEASSAVLNHALTFLPMDPPPGSPISEPMSPKAPSQEDLDELRKVSSKMDAAYWTLLSFLGDLSREAQNHLIGHLFGHRVPRRMALDPEAVVLSSSPESLDRLEKRYGLAEHLHEEALPSRVLERNRVAPRPWWQFWQRG